MSDTVNIIVKDSTSVNVTEKETPSVNVSTKTGNSLTVLKGALSQLNVKAVEAPGIVTVQKVTGRKYTAVASGLLIGDLTDDPVYTV